MITQYHSCPVTAMVFPTKYDELQFKEFQFIFPYIKKILWAELQGVGLESVA